MGDIPANQQESQASWPVRAVEAIGRVTIEKIGTFTGVIRFIGDLVFLISDTFFWIGRGLTRREHRIRGENVIFQMVRVGVRSIPIISLVQVFIGIILALQMAPTLEKYGQVERVADIVGIAMFRELGPLLSGVVLSGFAGASIAAELGTMVEGEEIKALRAIALNPVRFLVVPRFLATVVMLTMLTVIADVVGVLGGLFTSTTILGLSASQYLNATRYAVTNRDLISGMVKAAVFGLMISMIACQEGLSVSGGAEGVGRATTNTVVKSIVALITADVLFTATFYAFGF